MIKLGKGYRFKNVGKRIKKYDGERIAPRMKGKKAEFILDNTKGKDMKKGFTLILCFSREWCVHNFFAAFNHLKIDMDNCHLLVIDNSDLGTVQQALLKKLNIYKDYFYTTRLYKTWRMGGKELVTMLHAEWDVGKLPYIYEMQKDMLRLCTTKAFVLMEDDTLPPYKTRPDVVMSMLAKLESTPGTAVVSAIATGRSGVPYAKTRLGIHYLKREGNRIIWRLSPNPNLRGVHKVDAVGWYCCAAYKEPWLRAFDGMDKYVEDVPRFAMDVVHTNNIKLLGYDILADFSLWCEHMNHTSNRILFWGKGQAVAMIDVWLKEWQDYGQGIPLIKPEHTKMIQKIIRNRDK